MSAWRGSDGSEEVLPESARGNEYSSALFGSFTEAVDRLDPDASVLDLGPAASENLMFWIRRDRPIAAIDLVARAREGKRLELDGRRYGGVICWNVLSLLSADQAAEVVTRLVDALVPGGLLFAIFDGDGRREPEAVRYRILGEGRLRIEPVAGVAPPRAVPTSEIERLMRPLRPTRTTVMRHGSRETLGQIPKPPSDPFPGARTLGGR